MSYRMATTAQAREQRAEALRRLTAEARARTEARRHRRIRAIRLAVIAGFAALWIVGVLTGF